VIFSRTHCRRRIKPLTELSESIDSTTSRQIRELRLCDVFQAMDFSTVHTQRYRCFTTSNQVFR
jgi:hypothetical protein